MFVAREEGAVRTPREPFGSSGTRADAPRPRDRRSRDAPEVSVALRLGVRRRGRSPERVAEARALRRRERDRARDARDARHGGERDPTRRRRGRARRRVGLGEERPALAVLRRRRRRRRGVHDCAGEAREARATSVSARGGGDPKSTSQSRRYCWYTVARASSVTLRRFSRLPVAEIRIFINS